LTVGLVVFGRLFVIDASGLWQERKKPMGGAVPWATPVL
jgi:hypothetical protein